MMNRDEAIAGLIFAPGEDLPSWLIASVRKARSTLASIIGRERAYPGRKELRRRLEVLAEAIDVVRRETLNLDLALLLRAGDSALLNERETYQGLGDLAARVRNTLDALPARKGERQVFRAVRGRDAAAELRAEDQHPLGEGSFQGAAEHKCERAGSVRRVMGGGKGAGETPTEDCR